VIFLKTLSDNQLLEYLRKGYEKAFDELFDRYWSKSFDIAFDKVKSKEQAEEIVQDVFMDLWSKKDSLDIKNFSHFLFASIKYQSINKIRSKLVEHKYWDYYKHFVALTENVTDNTVRFNNLLEVIDEKLTKLSPKSKKVFYLSRLEGHSVKEIATKLSLSEKAIEYHISRSLKELKIYLKEFILALILFIYI
jgi:RNA polymerase sigma-70 factor (ECF subfamily)